MEGQIVRTFLTELESHGILESPGESHIHVVIHPICAEDELVSGLCNACAELLAGIRKTEGMILRYERAVEVVDVLGAHAMGNKGLRAIGRASNFWG